MNATVSLYSEISIGLYIIVFIYTIIRIAIVHNKPKLVNRSFVFRTYYSILMVFFFRILTCIFYLLWQEYELPVILDTESAMDLTYSGIYSVLHKLFNILPLPFLLLVVSFTAYEWFKILYKIEF